MVYYYVLLLRLVLCHSSGDLYRRNCRSYTGFCVLPSSGKRYRFKHESIQTRYCERYYHRSMGHFAESGKYNLDESSEVNLCGIAIVVGNILFTISENSS